MAFKGKRTHPIAHDALPQEVRHHLETSLPRLGLVKVTRSHRLDDGQYTWTVHFSTAIGDVPQLVVSSQLTGIEARIFVKTVVEGNSIQGSFALTFMNATTRSLPHDASAKDMALALENDIPKVLTAHVTRTDPTAAFRGRWHMGRCEHGLCDHGSGPAGGLVWTLTITTLEGNVSPTSPSSNQDPARDVTHSVGPELFMEVRNDLTGAGANVNVTNSHYYPHYK